MKYRLFELIIICFFLYNCSYNKKIQNNINKNNRKILAIVDNHNIYVDEIKEEFNYNNIDFNKLDKSDKKKIIDKYIRVRSLEIIAKKNNINKSDTFILEIKRFKTQTLIDLLVANIMNSIGHVTEKEILNFYNRNIDKYSAPKKYFIKNIVTSDSKVAEKVFGLIQQNKFKDLKGINNLKIIDLGQIEIDFLDDYLKPYLKNLKVNNSTPIIKSYLGYQILYCYKIIPQKKENLTLKLKKKINQIIFLKKYYKKINALLKKLKSKNFKVYYNMLE